MTAARSQGRAPLPGSLTAAERDFFEGLRTAAALAGLSQRDLEKLTAGAGSAGFCSRSHWGRTLNGQARPPLPAVRALAAAVGDAEELPALWARAFAGGGPAPAGGGPLARPRQLPGSVPYFTGREAELDALTRLADAARAGGGSPPIAAISGTAGVGKTALALHWAHNAVAEGRFPDGQLYVNLRGYDPAGPPADPDETLAGFAEALGAPAAQLPRGQQALAGLYRSLTAGRRMLVVLDNARDAVQARPLLPASGGCLVLVTSRSSLTGLAAADGARPLGLDVLGDGEAVALLSSRLGPRYVNAEPAAARDLSAACAGLPLALNIAAALAAARPGQTLASLAAALRARQALDLLDTGDPASSARAVFSWSYQSLGPEAAAMFRLLGLHPGPDITAAAAASLAGLPLGRTRSALDELTAAHLLAERGESRFAFHDLLRAYAAEQALLADPEPARRAALERALAHYAHTAHAAAALICPGRDLIPLDAPPAGVAPEPPAGGPAALAWFAAERAVITGCAALAADAGLGRLGWQAGWLLGRWLHRRGAWEDWAAVLETSLDAARRAGDRAGQAYAHRDLGAAYAAMCFRPDGGARRERELSQRHLDQALAICRQAGDDVGEAHVHLYLGRLLESESKVEEMLPHELEALRLFERAGHLAGQANALTNAGVCYRRLGDHDAALECCDRALELHRLAGNRDGEGLAWRCLGAVHRQTGDHGRAADCDRRSVAVFRDLGDQPQLARALAQLGDTLRAAGDDDGARANWREALAILEGIRDPEAATVRSRLS